MYKMILIVLLASPLVGCATIIKGSSQTLSLNTSPAGAKCELKRNGELLGYINPTPGTINVSKSKRDIDYLCELGGYDRAAGIISSSFQGWTLGNVIFGGVIGVGIDAASGSMTEYNSGPAIVLNKVTTK